MDLIIVNDSSSKIIHNYIELSDNGDDKNPAIDNLSREQIVVTGEIPADIRLGNNGSHIYIGVWDNENTSNSVDSSLVIDRETGDTSNQKFKKFNIKAAKDENQLVLTIGNNDGSKESGNTTKGLLITGIVLGSLIFIAFILWLIFA